MLSSALLSLMGIAELDSIAWSSRSAFTHVLMLSKIKSDFLHTTVKTFSFTSALVSVYKLMRCNRSRIFSFFAHTSSISFHTSMWEQNGNKTKSMSFLLNCVNLNDFWLCLFLTLSALFLSNLLVLGGSNLIKKYVKKVQKLHKQLWNEIHVLWQNKKKN